MQYVGWYAPGEGSVKKISLGMVIISGLHVCCKTYFCHSSLKKSSYTVVKDQNVRQKYSGTAPGGALGFESDVGARPGSRRANPILMEKISNSLTLFLWEN